MCCCIILLQIEVQDPELFELESMVKQLLAAAGSEAQSQHQPAEAAAAVADAAAGVGDGTSAKPGHAHHLIQICAVAGRGGGT
jgi:hypothetical protein